MDITITFGWWLVPAIATLASYGVAVSKFMYGGGDYSFLEFGNAILLLVATIPALLARLIWVLLA